MAEVAAPVFEVTLQHLQELLEVFDILPILAADAAVAAAAAAGAACISAHLRSDASVNSRSTRYDCSNSWYTGSSSSSDNTGQQLPGIVM